MKRLSLAVNEVLRKEQVSFRKGQGCTEHISLRNIIEQRHEWQRGLYINFIDFQKAFDSVHRESYGVFSGHMAYLHTLSE